MQRAMSSNRTMFIIVGFMAKPMVEDCLFFMLLLIYSVSIIGNLLIFTVICLEKSLHTPMYFFLSSLSCADIGFISCTVPTYLVVLATSNGIISQSDCIMQLYFYMSFGSIEFFLLACMSVDRYVAILYPLRYNNIITGQTCLCLIVMSWVVGVIVFLYPMLLLSNMSFCGPFEINHFFCEGSVLVKMSCSDTSLFYVIFTMIAATIVLVSFLISFVSYSFVITAVIKIPSSEGKRKTFSTCSSHFIAVILVYATVIFLYVRPAKSVSNNLNKALSTLNSILTPLSNPFIYSLRNKKIQHKIWRILKAQKRDI